MAAPPQTSRPASWPLSWISRWHHAFVFERRTRVLAEMLAAQKRAMGYSPTVEIEKAQQLLSSGAITSAEFERIKQNALV